MKDKNYKSYGGCQGRDADKENAAATESNNKSHQRNRYNEPWKADVHEMVGYEMVVLFITVIISHMGWPQSSAGSGLEDGRLPS